MSVPTDSERAFALWEDVNGHDPSIAVVWPQKDNCDPEYTVRVICTDTTVDLGELEAFIAAALKHGARHVFVEGGTLVMVL